jgi:enoyl-[acyl-carrier protein] reductase I
MYNLLKGKRGIILVLWMKFNRLENSGTYLRRRRCFVLTNAPASIRMGSIAELAQKLAPQSFLLMRHRLLI